MVPEGSGLAIVGPERRERVARVRSRSAQWSNLAFLLLIDSRYAELLTRIRNRAIPIFEIAVRE
jgi:hypothetical protein